MSPQATDTEPLLDLSTSEPNVWTPIAMGLQRDDEISVHLTTFNCANLPHPQLPIILPSSPPDLLVLGLQELAPSPVALLNLPVVNETYLKSLESIPALTNKAYGKEFELVTFVRIGQTALAIWSGLGAEIRGVQTAWAGCGVFGLIANKGAAAARLTIKKGIIISNVAYLKTESHGR
jgi:hypothetical protein